MSSDYVIFVLKAPVLLSQDEKLFIKNTLINYFNLDKIIFLISQIDLIDNDEISSISSYVRTFLSELSTETSIIPYSILKDRDMIHTIIDEKFLQHLGKIKHENFLDCISICIDTLEAEINRQLKIKKISEEAMLKVLNEIDAKASWFNSRIERIKNKIEAFINTIIKEDLLRDVEGFNNVLKDSLPLEIDSIDSLELIKKFLPLYIGNLWKEFFEIKSIKINENINTELSSIKKEIQDDFIKFFDDSQIDIDEMLSSININKEGIITNINPNRNINIADKIATGFGMLGLGLVFFNLPLAIVSLGSGHLLRKVFQNSIKESDKTAIKETLNNSLNDLLSSIEDSLHQSFNEYSKKLKDEVCNIYLNGINTLKTEFQENVKNYDIIKKNTDAYEKILFENIPALRSSLKEWRKALND
jgi:hypothetical protein